MNRLREKTTATILIAIFMISAFAVAMPALAVNVVHVYSGDKIQDAIDVASSGTVIIVHAGLYEEDLDIPVTLTGLELSGLSGAVIKGVLLSTWGSTTLPNIEILADGVKIHGFTIQGPDPSGTLFAAGMIIGAQDVEIYDNAFEVKNANDETNADDVSQGIVTYNKLSKPSVDVSGLSIHDNTFTHLGTGTIGYEGIYINRDAGTGMVTIADNDFTGDIIRGVTVERSNAIIRGNSLTPTGGWEWTGVLIMDIGAGQPQDAIDIIGNTIEEFGAGIKLGSSSTSQVLTSIDISQNTIESNVVGILVRSSANGVTVNTNNILLDNDMGVENLDTVNTLDAEYNWWGTTVDIVMEIDGDVDYEPYLTAAYSPSSTVLDVDVEVVEIVSISVTGPVDFGSPLPGGTPVRSVNVDNTGTVAIDVTATLIDEDPVDFYTDYLEMYEVSTYVPVVEWDLSLGIGSDLDVDLQLSVPDPCAPGTKSATLVFWAEAS